MPVKKSNLTLDELSNVLSFNDIEYLYAKKLFDESIAEQATNKLSNCKNRAIEKLYEKNIRAKILDVLLVINNPSSRNNVELKIDNNNLNLEDYNGYYIIDTNDGYIDGPFDSCNEASHEFDIHRDKYSSYRIVELSDEDYRYKWCE